MKKIVRLTESDLARLVKRIIKEQEGGDSKFSDPEKSQDWNKILNALGNTSQKHIKMRDGDYSLNWGSAAKPGYNWGMSVSKSGRFNFFTESEKIGEIVDGVIQKFGLSSFKEPFRSNPSFGGNIYEVETTKVIDLIKAILSAVNKK